MNTSRLLSLLDLLEDEFESGYEGELTNLIQAYGQARDVPGQDFSGNILAAKEKLESFLRASPTNELVPSRRQMLITLGAADLFGQRALASIQAATQSAVSGLAEVVRRLEEFKVELQKFHQSMTQIRKGLTSLGVEPDRLAPSVFEVGILIPREMTDGKLSNLNSELQEWNTILRTFAEVAGEEDREVTVRSLVTACLELYIIAGLVTAGMIAKVIDRVTEWYERILRIQILRKQLAELDAPSAETETIHEHEKGVLGRSIDELVAELLKGSPVKLEKGRRNELHAHLTISVKKIVRFVDKGGTLEVTAPEPEEEKFQTPTDEQGQPRVEEEIAAAKEKWEALQGAKHEEYALLQKRGAAAAKLPSRPVPILHLPDASSGAIGEDEKPGGKAKTRDDKNSG